MNDDWGCIFSLVKKILLLAYTIFFEDEFSSGDDASSALAGLYPFISAFVITTCIYYHTTLFAWHFQDLERGLGASI